MINWQQFGLRSNPYDTLPLIEGGELPIDKAFVGRTMELQSLKDIFLSDSRACLTILGNVGVGKTSLANFHKFLFKYVEKKKSLFSFLSCKPCQNSLPPSALLPFLSIYF